jgi:hypothetical protein
MWTGMRWQTVGGGRGRVGRALLKQSSHTSQSRGCLIAVDLSSRPPKFLFPDLPGGKEKWVEPGPGLQPLHGSTSPLVLVFSPVKWE